MLSVVISWHNRSELKQALPSIIENTQRVNGDITVVNFMGDADFLHQQIHDFQDQVKVVTVRNLNDKPRFNKPNAQNLGAAYSNQPYLFFCDCDIILPENLLNEMLEQFQLSESNFVTIKGVKETNLNAREANNLVMFGYELKLKIKDGSEVQIVDNEEDVTDGTRQAPGLLMVKRTDFAKVNGYNSRLHGWGWEDQDMICRLTLHAKSKRIHYGQALHISHDDQARMQSHFGFVDRWQSRDAMFRQALANYDSGDFLGTYLQDREKFKVEVFQLATL